MIPPSYTLQSCSKEGVLLVGALGTSDGSSGDGDGGGDGGGGDSGGAVELAAGRIVTHIIIRTK